MKRNLIVGSVFLGMLIASHLSYGQSTTNTTGQSTTSTTIQQTVTTPAKKARAVKRPAAAPTVEITESTTTTTPAAPRPAYDQAALKKMSNLCSEGFDAKVGNDNKNICSGKASPPDIAYSCVWMKKGDGAFSPTKQGPCSLDSAEHRGGVVISKADYKSSPPLSYGTKVECCYRAASGPATTSTTYSTH